MSWWLIVLICLTGYSLLSLLLVPVFVYDQIDQHEQFHCNYEGRICYNNRKTLTEGSLEDKQRVARKCSAKYVSSHSAVLPFMMLAIIPRLFAFSIVNRLENKDKKIRELEQQKKRAEEEKKATEEQQRNLLAEFDIVMTKIEDEAKAKEITA